MKTIKEYILENLANHDAQVLAEQEQIEKEKEQLQEAEKSISDEKSFREYAENKFKNVFGDKLDEQKMNDTIDGILKDHKEDADKGDWGKLVGILNKSFA